MSVPKEFRRPEMLTVLRENSEKLQTTFDVRATFLDILKVVMYFIFKKNLASTSVKFH